MAKKKIFCFTHHDLDGAVTLLVTKWAHPGYTFNHLAVTTFEMRNDITQWLLNNSFSDYEKVYFLDLDTSSISDLIDHENVIIIDHHKSHVDNMKYLKAVPIVKEYSSASLLSYKVFRKLYNSDFTNEQKTLVLIANDYDSYKLELEQSKMLNVIFWQTQNSFESFITNFANGFFGFSKQQTAMYRIYETDLKNYLAELKVFRGVHACVDGEYRVVVAAFADKFINECADLLLNKYEADVAVIVNMKTKHVSFRRPKNGTMRLDVFAKDIAEGGGHEAAAGGQITDVFMDFTKSLNPI